MCEILFKFSKYCILSFTENLRKGSLDVNLHLNNLELTCFKMAFTTKTLENLKITTMQSIYRYLDDILYS